MNVNKFIAIYLFVVVFFFKKQKVLPPFDGDWQNIAIHRNLDKRSFYLSRVSFTIWLYFSEFSHVKLCV